MIGWDVCDIWTGGLATWCIDTEEKKNDMDPSKKDRIGDMSRHKAIFEKLIKQAARSPNASDK
jgi:hypothetical protein